MLVDSLMYNPGPDIYYDDSFRNVLEDHMPFLRSHASTRMLSVEPMAAFKHEHDLFGLFQAIGVPAHLHWVTMRMNHFTGPTDNTRAIGFLMIPDATTVDQIRQSHMSTRKVP